LQGGSNGSRGGGLSPLTLTTVYGNYIKIRGSTHNKAKKNRWHIVNVELPTDVRTSSPTRGPTVAA